MSYGSIRQFNSLIQYIFMFTLNRPHMCMTFTPCVSLSQVNVHVVYVCLTPGDTASVWRS